MYFTLIIPAYNEEERIEKVVNTYGPYFEEKFPGKFEFLIIVNNSSDRTLEVVKELQRTHHYLRWANFPYYTGKGGALVEGFKIANGEVIGFVDSDLAVVPDQYMRLFSEIEDNDVVIASRWVKGAKVMKWESWKTVFAGRIYNLIVRGFFGLNVKDTQCGGKIFKKEVVKRIIPNIRVKGFGIDLDLLYKSKKAGARIKEIPITWSHINEGSKTRVMNSSKMMFKELFITRFKK